jgi:L-fuculose-phosphate aldolase
VSTNSLREASSRLEGRYRREICSFGRRMYERGYIVACEGNLSIRLDAGRILIAPACKNKGMMSPDDLVIMDMEGHHLRGDHKVSSEAGMHLLFYRMRPDVRAVCHGHPTIALGFVAAGESLDHAFTPELAANLGKVAIVRYATPAAPELGTDIELHVSHCDALLLANHGVVTCGPDLITAFDRIEVLEHFAKTVLTTRLVGEPRSFSTRGPAKPIAPHLRCQMPTSPSSGAELQGACKNADNASDKVMLTRGALDALVDEAVRKDRALWEGFV